LLNWVVLVSSVRNPDPPSSRRTRCPRVLKKPRVPARGFFFACMSGKLESAMRGRARMVLVAFPRETSPASSGGASSFLAWASRPSRPALAAYQKPPRSSSQPVVRAAASLNFCGWLKCTVPQVCRRRRRAPGTCKVQRGIAAQCEWRCYNRRGRHLQCLERLGE